MTWTHESFTDHYGKTPQEFFAETVHGDATGRNIPVWEAEVAAAQAKLDAIPDPQSIPDDGREIGGYTHLTAILARADLETLINARTNSDLKTAHFRQRGAKAFLGGQVDRDHEPDDPARGQRDGERRGPDALRLRDGGDRGVDWIGHQPAGVT